MVKICPQYNYYMSTYMRGNSRKKIINRDVLCSSEEWIRREEKGLVTIQ
jgi:hypothetical protein